MYILIVCCQNLEKSTRWNSLYLISFRLLIGLDLSSWCELIDFLANLYIVIVVS